MDGKPAPEVIKPFFMLYSVKHEILNALKYILSRNLAFFSGQIDMECYFSRL